MEDVTQHGGILSKEFGDISQQFCHVSLCGRQDEGPKMHDSRQRNILKTAAFIAREK